MPASLARDLMRFPTRRGREAFAFGPRWSVSPGYGPHSTIIVALVVPVVPFGSAGPKIDLEREPAGGHLRGPATFGVVFLANIHVRDAACAAGLHEKRARHLVPCQQTMALDNLPRFVKRFLEFRFRSEPGRSRRAKARQHGEGDQTGARIINPPAGTRAYEASSSCR